MTTLKRSIDIRQTCILLIVALLLLPWEFAQADGFSFDVPFKIYNMPPYINGVKISCIVYDRKRKRELARQTTSTIRLGDTKNTIYTGKASLLFLVTPSKQKYMKKPMIYECSMSLCRGQLCMSPRPDSWASVSAKSYWKETGTLEPLKKK